jgi:hypothetical protein
MYFLRILRIRKRSEDKNTTMNIRNAKNKSKNIVTEAAIRDIIKDKIRIELLIFARLI